jgi:hypothetical protein
LGEKRISLGSDNHTYRNQPISFLKSPFQCCKTFPILDHLITKAGEKAMSDEDLKAELERLRQENAVLKKGAASGTRLKVSEKGAVSVYGLGRFPVTLYKEQWLKLLDMSSDIRAFIAANEAQLKAKDR